MEKSLHDAANTIRNAKRLLAITGAGISADCGLPTYRGKGGLYVGGATAEGIPIEQALSGEMLLRKPEVCWNHIGRIEQACRGVQPSAGHRALVELEQHCAVTVLTQNIDGFHGAAGSRDVIEMHGNFYHLSCSLDAGCGLKTTVSDYADLSLPPPCPECGKPMRPDVVLFGEMLPESALNQLYTAMSRQPDVVLSIGTTSVFPYIAAPVIECQRWGGTSIEINPGFTEVSTAVDIRLTMTAAEALPRIISLL